MTLTELAKHISVVVDYNWGNEVDDFVENHVDDNGVVEDDPDHILFRLLALRNYVNHESKTLQDVVDEHLGRVSDRKGRT